MNRITTAVHERHFYNASSRTAAIHERLQGPETELLFMLRLYDSVCLVILHMFISFVFVSAKCLQRDQCHQSSGTAAPLISKGRAELNSKLCFFFFFFQRRGQMCRKLGVIFGHHWVKYFRLYLQNCGAADVSLCKICLPSDRTDFKEKFIFYLFIIFKYIYVYIYLICSQLCFCYLTS